MFPISKKNVGFLHTHTILKTYLSIPTIHTDSYKSDKFSRWTLGAARPPHTGRAEGSPAGSRQEAVHAAGPGWRVPHLTTWALTATPDTRPSVYIPGPCPRPASPADLCTHHLTPVNHHLSLRRPQHPLRDPPLLPPDCWRYCTPLLQQQNKIK